MLASLNDDENICKNESPSIRTESGDLEKMESHRQKN